MTDALGRHAIALASVREVAARAGAKRVVLLLDEGAEDVPTMVEWAEGGTFEVTEGGVTEPVDPAALAGVVPAVTPDVRPVPPTALTVDPDTGELAAPIGVARRHRRRRSLRWPRRSAAAPSPPPSSRPASPSTRSRSPRARASASSRSSGWRRSRSRRAGPSPLKQLGDQLGGARRAVALHGSRSARAASAPAIASAIVSGVAVA